MAACQLTVFRDGKTRELQVPLQADGNFVIPPLLDKYPRYFIYGPMVFMPASRELMRGAGRQFCGEPGCETEPVAVMRRWIRRRLPERKS